MDPAARLSKPRLVKLRKPRPSSAPSSAPSGFNPFDPAAAADVRGRTPYAAPDPGNVASTDSFVNSGTASFVFGATAKNDHRTSNLRDAAFAFGSSNLDEEIGKLNLGTSSTGLRRTASLGMDEESASQLPDVIRKLNLYGDGNETDRAERRPKVVDDNAFVFGGGKDKCNVRTRVPDPSVSGSGGANLFAGLPSEMEKLNLQRPDNATFVFGGSKNKSDEGTQNPDPGVSVSGSGLYRNGDFMSGLPNEMGKLNLQRPDVDANGHFVFGGSKNKPNEETQKPNPGRTNLYQNISRGSDGEFFSGLPNEMERLNLQRTEMSANGTFVFRGSKDVNGEDSRSFDPTAFLFGKIGSNLSSNSSFGSDEGSFTRIPDEMRKLNLQTGGKKNGFKMRKNKNCKFGGRVNMGNSSTNGDANKLPEDMKNLNIRKDAAATGKKDGVGFSADVSVSGINSKLGSVTSQTATMGFTSLDKGKAPDHPDDAKKSDAQSSRPGFDTINTRDSDFRDKVDPGPSFVFGNSSSASVLFGATTRNSNLVDRSERLARSTEPVFAMDGSRTSEPSSFKFTFQNGKRDDTLNMGSIPRSQTNENVNPTPVATPLAYPSSSGQPVGSAFTSRNTHEGFETSQMEFKIQKEDPFWFSEENLCTSLRQSMAFCSKEEAKGAKTRKRRGKSRQRVSIVKPFVSKENISPENSEHESLGAYSPMDYSPYQETLVADQGSTETSVASNESVHPLYHSPLTESHISSSKDGREETIPVSMDGREESIITAAQRMTINDGDLKYEEPNEAGPEVCAERIFFSQFSSVEEQTSGLENLSVPIENDSVRLYNDNISASFEAETGGTFTSNDKKEAGEGRSFFTFASSIEDHKKSNLTFVASSEQGPLLASKHRHRRKSRSKTGQDSYIPTSNAKVPLQSPSPNWFPVARTSVDSDPQKGTSDSLFSLKTKNEINTEKNRKPDASQEPTTKVTASIAVKDACEKWRLRGNQAYANGHLSKAEDYYTRGVNSVPSDQMSGTCIQALMLCHSNRAATRMSLGRMREAIIDCKVALALDPNFQRAQVRAANCHLALGEIKDSLEHFKNCLQLENKVNCDEKILSEASEGLKKAQQVGDWMNQSMELLLKRTRDDATQALQFISEALSISPYSESLLEMKAEALLMVHNYEEVIQISENSLDLAEKNSVIIGDEGQSKDIDNSENRKVYPERLWRWRLISMSYFYLGKFEEALELLQKHEKVKPIAARFWNKSQKPSRSLSVTICELLRLKVAGNEAFQAGKHLEAVEHYTSALTCNTESRPFTAICFCNRAAAYQALGQITNAIADCSLAIALDSSYQKAISRRATLHELIRDYGQAVNDLNRLISLLEKQSEDNDIISGETTQATRNCNDLKRARTRLSLMQDQARKGTPLDMYMILGVEPTSSAADVKKAYRKAALRHHPDKAGHYLTRSGTANDGLWKEVAVEVHGDADRLFKMIGEAYAVLSDSNKRLQYDEDEEMRNILKKGYTDTPKSRADAYGNQYDRGYHTRQWRPYESAHQRWSESSYYNR